MSDVQEQAEAADTETEAKGEALDAQFAAADAEANPEQTAPLSLEDVAASIGWTPKEQYRGDPDKWKPADQFIVDGRKSERNMKRQLDEMRGTMESVAKTTGAIMAERIAQAEAALSARYAKAVDEGDHDAAWQVSNQIRDLRERTAPQRPGPLPETIEWAKKNSWMDTDLVARNRALQVAQIYADNGYGPADQIAQAEAVIRREFPHHFSGGEKAPDVNGPRSRASGASRGGTTFDDMPKVHKDIAADLLERGLINDKNAYARNYFAGLGKGK